MIEVFGVDWFLAGLHLSVPLIFAALGGLLSERAGVINIALEGMMLAGAFTGVAVTWWLDQNGVGLVAAVLVGALLGAVLGWFAVTLRANQIVAATAINLIAVGVTAALIPIIWGKPGASEGVDRIRPLDVGPLADVPFLGRILADLTLVDWAAILLAPVIWVVLYQTAFGLRLRSCGESPTAAASVGVDVLRLRYVAVMASGFLAALGGAYLSLVQVGVFQRGMTGGRGFLALAALIFGKWKPIPVLGACLLFGLADAYQFRAQASGVELPTELLLALPYLVALVALATVVGRASAPAAIGQPYVKE